jgi:hypothetical protein
MGKTLKDAFQVIFKLGRRPIRLQTDKGTAFTYRVFQKFLNEHDVHFFTTYNEETKASIVERFNRTLKTNKYSFLNVRLALLSRTLSPGENLHDVLGPFLPYSLLDTVVWLAHVKIQKVIKQDDAYKIQSVLKNDGKEDEYSI